jgi:thiamine pyrophosphokinase
VPSALIFAAAPLQPTPRLRARLPPHPFVVAADGGAATALAFGYTPNVVLGDFDSLDAETLQALTAQRVTVESFPRDKDKTDGQLAIERALTTEPDALYMIGFLGGPRLDMTVANVLLLTRQITRAILLDERNEATIIRAGTPYEWSPEPDEIVSLIPLVDDVVVSTYGLRWPLNADRLEVGDTRGLSNEPVSNPARVELHAGAALLMRHFARV